MGTSSKLQWIFPNALWLGEISRQFPHFQFQVKAFVPISQDPFIGKSLIVIIGAQLDLLFPFLDAHRSLKAYSILDETPTSLSLATQTRDDFLLRSIVRNGILVHLPFSIIKGQAEVTITGTRENIDQFITDLSERGFSVEIISIGQYSNDLLKQQLTPRQFEIYMKAKEAGLYDSPRKITLTELADQLELAKSTLSSLLQRVHKKLLGNA